jgi:branched-chain amino acid transport system substrate-binding protein
LYLTKVAKRPDGLYETEIVKRVVHDSADPYAAECPMK